MVETD